MAMAAAAALCGCGVADGKASAGEPPPIDHVAIARDLLGDTDDEALHHAVQRLIARCVTDGGAEYDPEEYVDQPETPTRWARDAREEHGFGLSRPSQQSVPMLRSENTRRLESMSAPQRAVYVALVDECTLAANQTIEDRRASYIDSLPAPVVAALAPDVALSGPHQMRAFADWRRCMEAAGYARYATEAGPMSVLQEDWDAVGAGSPEAIDEFRELERAVALVDFDCASDTVKPAHEATIAALADLLGEHGVPDFYAEVSDE